MIKKLKCFDLTITDKGISVMDKRHSPPRKCGKLSWQEVMDVIECEYGQPTISPTGL